MVCYLILGRKLIFQVSSGRFGISDDAYDML